MAVPVLAALLSVASAASAMELPPAEDVWMRVETEHFTLFSNASRRRTLAIGRSLESFRVAIARIYPTLLVDSHRPGLVYVFKHDGAFRPYKYLEDRGGTLAGYFLDRRTANYIAMNANTPVDPLDIIFHEYTHHVLHINFANTPLWFSEGLAEAFSTFECDDRSARIGKQIDRHLLTLRRQSLIPLRELFAMTTAEPIYNEGERVGVLYAESWALVHYLMWARPDLRPGLGAFLDRVGRGDDAETAFRDSFALSMEEMEVELKRYVRDNRWFHYTELRGTGMTAMREPEVRGMSRAETLVALGDLLAGLDAGRSKDAEAHFVEALRLDPAQARAHAGLGLLRDMDGRPEEAIPYYEKALTLAPEDPLVLCLLGEILSRRGRAGGATVPSDYERAGDLFRRSIAAAPDFAEPYIGYGLNILSSGGEPGPAIRLLEAAARMLPARPDILANLAMLYDREGLREQALRLVDEVLPRMGDSAALQAARSRIQRTDGPVPPPVGPAAGQHGGETKTGETAAAEGVPPSDPADGDDPGPPDAAGGERVRHPREADEYNRQVELINQAVRVANGGDIPTAIALLEGLLPRIGNDTLAGQAREILARMKKDWERLSKGRP